jgi:hypothetical protein
MTTYRTITRTTSGYINQDWNNADLLFARLQTAADARQYGSSQLWVLANTGEWLHLETVFG